MSNDRSTINAVVGLLGALGVLLTATLAAIVVTGRDVDDAVMTLLGTQLGAVVGALGAMLAQTGSGRYVPSEPASGTAEDPVHVDLDEP